MNRLDDFYIFRHACLADCDELMRFIDDEWQKKDHILAKNREFFLYEFRYAETLTFSVATNRKSGKIDAILGYLRTCEGAEFDTWTVMWLTRRSGAMPFLGIELFKRMKEIVGYRHSTGVGANPVTALPLVKNRAGHFAYKLKHFYILSSRGEFRIANIIEPKYAEKPADQPQFRLIAVDKIDDIQDCVNRAAEGSIPRKDAWYINKRFFCHPIYSYYVWKIDGADDSPGLLIGREIRLNGAAILRLVDFIGSPQILDGLYEALRELISRNGYEYIDFYVSGIEDGHLTNAGFVLRTDGDGNIIPNYFEPFVQSNIDIYGTSTAERVRMCKADADQDRPNFW